MGWPWLKESSLSSSQGTGPASATEVLEIVFLRYPWLRCESGIWSRRCRTLAIGTGSSPCSSGRSGSQMECTL
eukprot:3826504-Heterocapsa_arctica.AAC.1